MEAFQDIGVAALFPLETKKSYYMILQSHPWAYIWEK